MASFRGIKIEYTVIQRDDSVTEVVWFEESTLREVTRIGDWCFGLDQEHTNRFVYSELGIDSFRAHHASIGPSVLDLSLLVNCEEIGDCFAAGHYGPVILPPALKYAAGDFMVGSKCRVLQLPDLFKYVGANCFAYATADRIIFPNNMSSFGHVGFERAQIGTLEIPGSVGTINEGFCRSATIGTLTFAESNADERDTLYVRSFLKHVTVQTLNLRRSVQLLEDGNSAAEREGRLALDASAMISVLRRLVPTQMSDSVTDVRAGLLADLHGAPHEKATPTDPVVSRPARRPRPKANASSDIDLAALEVFEHKHRRLVQKGDTIDMSGLINCCSLGPRCFAKLTGVSTLLLPLNLSKISRKFMENANVPELDIVFPKSLQDVEDGLLDRATVRTVNFAACDRLTTLSSCFRATITNMMFPPNLQRVNLNLVNSPHLDLVFPPSLQQIPQLIEATVRSIDCSACGDVRVVESECLKDATFESFVFPPNVTTTGRGFMEGAHSPNADLVFPSSLSTVESELLKKATVRSVDFSKCDALRSISEQCFDEATVASLSLPPNLCVLKKIRTQGDPW